MPDNIYPTKPKPDFVSIDRSKKELYLSELKVSYDVGTLFRKRS